jgi:hypothetical protein
VALFTLNKEKKMLNLFTTAIALTFVLSTAVIANTEEPKKEVKVEETKEVTAEVSHEADKPAEAKKEDQAKHHKRKKHRHAERAPAIADNDAVRAPLSEVQEHPESVVNEQ